MLPRPRAAPPKMPIGIAAPKSDWMVSARDAGARPVHTRSDESFMHCYIREHNMHEAMQ